MARPTLSELSCFVAVATHKNFRMAADSLGVTRSNLSHAVRALEERMGVQLLRRTTRSVAMTDVGEHLLESLRPVLDDLDRALDQVEHFRERPCGVLRISAPIESVRELLEVVVPEFRRRHPEVELELDSNGKFVDIVASGFDAGVRLRESVPDDMIAVPFGAEVRYVLVASPAYITRHGTPQTPDALRDHACVRHRLPSGKIWGWELGHRGRAITFEPPGGITLDDSDLTALVARSGLAIAFVPEFVVRTDLSSGALTTLLRSSCPSFGALCLYYPKHRQLRPALRAFIDVLRKHAPTTSDVGRRPAGMARAQR